VTLIAAFRTKEGVAICADSQETVTNERGHEYRKTVQKIAPIAVGQYQIAIAGSGDGELIDAFVELAERRLRGDVLPPSITQALSLIEDELDKFYMKHITPVDGASMTLFIAAYCPTDRRYEVWVSRKQYLKPLEEAQLIGWDEEMYWVTTKRLYRTGMSLTQAVLAAVHVLVIGEESSNYIKGPFSLTIVRDNGIWVEDSEYVETLRGHLKEFETYTNQILLACADTSIYSSHLQKSIEQFAKVAKAIHEKQMNAVAEQIFDKDIRTFTSSIPKLPPGIMVEVSAEGKLSVRHDVNGVEEMTRRVNEALERQRKEEDAKGVDV
jgi:hypothetical protein